MLPGSISARFNAWLCGVLGYLVLAAAAAGAVRLLTWNIADPSLTHAASGPVRNLLGPVGAIVADLIMQLLGLAGVLIILPPLFWALQLIGKGRLDGVRTKLLLAPVAVLLLACAASSLPRIASWPLPHNVGGLMGDLLLNAVTSVLAAIRPERASTAAGLFCFAGGMLLLMTSLGLSRRDLKLICRAPHDVSLRFISKAWQRLGEMSERATIVRREPTLAMPAFSFKGRAPYQPPQPAFVPAPRPHPPVRSYGPAPQEEPGNIDVTADPEFDRKKLDRILSICGPQRGGKPAATNEPSSVLLPPEAPDSLHPHAPDPIRDAREGIADPRDGTAWPAPPPVAPMVPPANGWRPQSLPGGDDLYGRAVAIVLDDRKASANYLQQRLAIGYMRAADLIERMEREGILGAPVYNGMRPILIGGPGSREI